MTQEMILRKSGWIVQWSSPGSTVLIESELTRAVVHR